jgi:hypothetical protein
MFSTVSPTLISTDIDTQAALENTLILGPFGGLHGPCECVS